MGRVASLLALQPVADQVIQHRQRHRAGGHHRGVEAAVLDEAGNSSARRIFLPVK